MIFTFRIQPNVRRIKTPLPYDIIQQGRNYRAVHIWFLSSGLYRRFRNCTESAFRLVDYTTGGEFHSALKQIFVIAYELSVAVTAVALIVKRRQVKLGFFAAVGANDEAFAYD